MVIASDRGCRCTVGSNCLQTARECISVKLKVRQPRINFTVSRNRFGTGYGTMGAELARRAKLSQTFLSSARSAMVKGKQAFAMTPSFWDVPPLVVLLVVTFFLERGVAPAVRPAWLANPALQKPHLPDVIPARLLLLGTLTLPFLAFLLVECAGLRSKRALFLFFTVGLLESAVPTVLLTNVLKLVIGRPRPYFSHVCVAYNPLSSTSCTGDAREVAEARKSFPSGHSSLSFAVAIFVALYLHLRLGARASPAAPRTWRLLAVLTFPLLAALVAASRVIDFHHHYADIVGGSLLGAAVAVAAFEGRRPALTALTEERDRWDTGGGLVYDAVRMEDPV